MDMKLLRNPFRVQILVAASPRVAARQKTRATTLGYVTESRWDSLAFGSSGGIEERWNEGVLESRWDSLRRESARAKDAACIMSANTSKTTERHWKDVQRAR